MTVSLHIYIVREETMASGLGWYDTFWQIGCWSLGRLFRFLRASCVQCFGSNHSVETAEIGIKAGIATEEVPVRPYDLRKYFNTRLKLAGMNETLVEYMMGHSLGRVKGAYFVPPVLESRRFHSQYYQHISIGDRSWTSSIFSAPRVNSMDKKDVKNKIPIIKM